METERKAFEETLQWLRATAVDVGDAPAELVDEYGADGAEVLRLAVDLVGVLDRMGVDEYGDDALER